MSARARRKNRRRGDKRGHRRENGPHPRRQFQVLRDTPLPEDATDPRTRRTYAPGAMAFALHPADEPDLVGQATDAAAEHDVTVVLAHHQDGPTGPVSWYLLHDRTIDETTGRPNLASLRTDHRASGPRTALAWHALVPAALGWLAAHGCPPTALTGHGVEDFLSAADQLSEATATRTESATPVAARGYKTTAAPPATPSRTGPGRR